MILHALRALFVLMMAAVGWFFVQHPTQPFGDLNWLIMSGTLTLGVIFICIDILAPRKKLAIFSGTFLGLVVGISIAYALSFVVQLLVDQYMPRGNTGWSRPEYDALVQFANLTIGVICCYLAISFILQTKDDFRFIVPYVEFSKQTRGPRPMLIDTSVIIDGRILDVADTGILDGRLIVPRFVVDELQTLADNGDRLKRNRGRRGLDVLNKLRNNRRVEVVLFDANPRDEEARGVDQKLVAMGRELPARLLTLDFNLSKVAELQQVEVINLNDLATALKPVVLPGEKLQIRLVKAGEEASQGVGYLEDGTMVVVDQGRAHLNEDVEVTVTTLHQTSSGRMIFARLGDAPPPRKGHKGRPGGDRGPSATADSPRSDSSTPAV